MLEFLKNYWYIILAAAAVAAVGSVLVVNFFRKTRSEQVAKVKEWLLYAVLAAEKEFGSGTGQLKLRSVYDLFVSRFPWLAKIVPFETFSGWVDEALSKTADWLNKDEAVANYVTK